jgi:hypothetical protein
MAWDEVKTCTMNACWKCLWPEVMNDFKVFPTVVKEVAEIVKLGAKEIEEWLDDMRGG